MLATMVHAGIYARISRDDQGDGLGVARQERACRELAARLGWTIVGVYTDNSISAYDRRKKRAQYEQMLTDIATGRIDGVLAWAQDRLTRHPIELERLVEVFQTHKTAVQTVVGGEIDLNTEEGQFRARIMGNVAKLESGRKSERLRDKMDEIVKTGRRPCGGPRPFGMDRHYDDPDRPDRRIVAETINPVEADAIRDAAKRLLRGESVRSVVAEWNHQGLLSTQGKPWSVTSFRSMIVRPRLAGLVVHRGQIVEGVKAQWPQIIDRDTHEALVAKVAFRRSARTSNALKFWLTGHVFCTCGTTMRVGKTTTGRRKYECKPKVEGGCGGRVIGLDDLEAMMRDLVIGRLNDPGILREIAARQGSTRRDAELIVQTIELDERRLKALRSQLADCEPEEILDMRASIRTVRARINSNRDRLAELTGEFPLAGIDVAELGERWPRLDPLQRAGLLRVAGIGRIVILPAVARGRFDPDRVVLEPVDRSPGGG